MAATSRRATKSSGLTTRWIRSGRRVDAAHATSQATAKAIGIACVAWQTVAGLVCRTRWRLDRARDAVWEKDIRELLDDGGRYAD